MVSIILSCDDDTRAKAKLSGFTEQTVLIRHDAVQSTPENKKQLEKELFKLGPLQFLVADYWGMVIG